MSLCFLIVGLYLLVGRFWFDSRIRRHLRYLVTNRRILVLKDDRASASKSLDIKHLPTTQLDERPDGSGTITFGTSANPFGRTGFAIW